MTNKEYREHEGISKSSLFKIATSPFHFKYALDNPTEDTKALCFGRAAHKYILEKDDFFNEFAISPNVDKRSTAGKIAWAEFTDGLRGREAISPDEFEQIKAMSDVIDGNPLARQLLTGVCESSWFWLDSMTGEWCKCRPDCLTEFEGKKYIIDYKTTDSCADGHFERSVKKYGYDLQSGMYCEGMFCNTLDEYGFAFVAQEKKAPYAVRVYFCDPEFIAKGQDLFHSLLGLFHHCKETDNWFGYEGEFNQPATLYAEDYGRTEREEE